MEQKLRKSGINIIGDVPWGTHFCQFYQTKQDLIDILVPYFKAGLENNEFCMWITSQPLEVNEAKEALRKDVPDIDVYVEKGQIEIIPYTQWYVKEGIFDSERLLNGWVEKLNQALSKGYDGLRLTGNTFWLEKKDWKDFVDYEEEVDKVLGNYRIISLCTYSLDMCNANEVIDVVVNYQFALISRNGKWEQIESLKRKQAEKSLRITLESIKDGFFACDEDWRFVYVNAQAERILGICREEVLGKSHWDVFPLTLGTNLELEYRCAAAGEVRDFKNYYEPWGRWFHNRCFPREGGGISEYGIIFVREGNFVYAMQTIGFHGTYLELSEIVMYYFMVAVREEGQLPTIDMMPKGFYAVGGEIA
jgi:PAS domain S-box-containing protein